MVRMHLELLGYRAVGLRGLGHEPVHTGREPDSGSAGRRRVGRDGGPVKTGEARTTSVEAPRPSRRDHDAGWAGERLCETKRQERGDCHRKERRHPTLRVLHSLLSARSGQR
jgi:hypothetical protein